MADNAKKTEHSGAKHGSGAYWGAKARAKDESNTARRREDARAAYGTVWQEDEFDPKASNDQEGT